MSERQISRKQKLLVAIFAVLLMGTLLSNIGLIMRDAAGNPIPDILVQSTDNDDLYDKEVIEHVTSAISKRENKNDVYDLLQPHPYLSDVTVFQQVQNVSFIGASSDDTLEKRYLWWVLAVVWKVAETGVAMWNLVTACEDWSSSVSNKINCVYGALSTLATIAGAGWGGYKYASAIFRALHNFWGKRDVTEPLTTDQLNVLRLYQEAMVNHTKLDLTPMLYADGSLVTDPNNNDHPLMFGYDGEGVPSYFSAYYIGGENNTVYARMAAMRRVNGTLSKRENFNDQDFTKGGLEASFGYNQQYDGGWLDPSNDYQQMFDEMACRTNGLANNALSFQIYDNNHQGTIAGGNIRACSDGSYGTDWLTDVTGGIPLTPGCQIS